MKLKFTGLLAVIFISNFALAVQATYTVPTDDQNLQKLKTQKVNYISINAEKLEFTMPTHFAPNDYTVQSFERSTKTPNTYVGLYGSAKCLQNANGEINCKLDYNSLYANFLTKNLDQTIEQIEQLPLVELDKKNLEILATRFSGDPIGILKIFFENDIETEDNSPSPY